jgi:phage terminase small subunit
MRLTKTIKPKSKRKPRSLTEKQKWFIHWYCSAEVNMNGTEAARRAGYKGNDHQLGVVGSENLAKPGIRAAIDKRLKAAMKGADVTVEATLRRVSTIGDKALADGQYASAAKCAELHGKYLKMWTERIEHVQTIEDVSTEELVRLLREIAENGGIDLIRLIAGDGPIDGVLPAPPGSPTAH